MATVIVPKVVGMDLYVAVDTLRAVGLGSSSAYAEVSGVVGEVIEQTPPAGTTADVGSTVALKVVAPKGGTVIVPALAGLLQAVAEDRVASAGLVLHSVSRQFSSFTPGIVIAQSITAGETVPRGWPIGITLAIAKE